MIKDNICTHGKIQEYCSKCRLIEYFKVTKRPMKPSERIMELSKETIKKNQELIKELILEQGDKIIAAEILIQAVVDYLDELYERNTKR